MSVNTEHVAISVGTMILMEITMEHIPEKDFALNIQSIKTPKMCAMIFIAKGQVKLDYLKCGDKDVGVVARWENLVSTILPEW